MMSLAACMRRWPSTTRWPWLAYSLLPRNGSSTEASRLLELEEERVLVVATEHEQDPGPGADAADADHLACRMHVAKALEQPTTVTRQRAPVGADDGADESRRSDRRSAPTISSIGHEERRIADDPQLAVDDLGQLAERLQAVLRPCLCDVLLRRLICFADRHLLDPRDELVDVEARVPEVEIPHPANPAHRLAGTPAPTARLTDRALLVVEAPIATGDREARDEALHIPLEGTGQRLVEVVDAEDEAGGREPRRRRSSRGARRRRAARGGPSGAAREIGGHEVARRRDRT